MKKELYDSAGSHGDVWTRSLGYKEAGAPSYGTMDRTKLYDLMRRGVGQINVKEQ